MSLRLLGWTGSVLLSSPGLARCHIIHRHNTSVEQKGFTAGWLSHLHLGDDRPALCLSIVSVFEFCMLEIMGRP